MPELIDQDVVTRLAFYPGKSFREGTVDGAQPDSLEVGPTGFEAYGVRDRDYVLAYQNGDPDNAAFVSQRGWGAGNRKVEHPQDRKLATVEVDVRPDHVVFSAPGFGVLEVGTEPTDGPRWSVDVFGKKFPGIVQNEEYGRFFSRFLDGHVQNPRDLQLVRADRSRPRYLPDRYQRDDASNRVSGADGMPFLLASEASLAQLHYDKRLPLGTVSMSRYRPNIIIGGETWGAWAEDSMDVISIGEMGAYVVKACSRCPIPNTDQETGEYDGASSRLLGGRAGEIFTGEKGVFFAQNLNHIYTPDELVVLRTGDPVRVVKWADKPNVDLRVKA